MENTNENRPFFQPVENYFRALSQGTERPFFLTAVNKKTGGPNGIHQAARTISVFNVVRFRPRRK